MNHAHEHGDVRREFESKGYALARGLAEPERLAKVQASIAKLLEIRSERPLSGAASGVSKSEVDRRLLELHSAGPQHKSFIYDTLPNLPEVVGLATSPNVMMTVRQCLGLSPDALVTFINVNLRIDFAGTEWEHNLPWHQDYPYRNKLYTKGASAVLWMPVFDCPAVLGPVEVMPGSQRAGEVSTVEISREIGAPHWSIPEESLRQISGQIERPELRAGDALVFDILLVHRSGVNRDPHALRWTLQARYSSVESPHFLEQYSTNRASS